MTLLLLKSKIYITRWLFKIGGVMKKVEETKEKNKTKNIFNKLIEKIDNKMKEKSKKINCCKGKGCC